MKTDYEYENKLTGQADKQDRLLIGGSLGLYYNANLAEGLYVYLGPRLDNARYEEDGDNGDGSKRESREQAMSISAVFGLKYLFNDHFALFADFGVGYFSKNETEKYWNNAGVLTTNSERRTDYVALSRGLLGVVFYL
jgi:opacity protein-like surface antigen